MVTYNKFVQPSIPKFDGHGEFPAFEGILEFGKE